MRPSRSDKLFARAERVIPGGVNSPVRAFKSVGRNPLFIKKAKGAYVWDEDGNRFLDYIGSWGPMILGHAHPAVIAAVRKAATMGTSFGASTRLEVEMAELVCKMVPTVESVRMVNSGTEATMSAVRLARAYTRRELIVKFEGCYHGHSDSFLIKAGSGAMTLGIPDSPGVPAAVAAGTLNAPYNSLESVQTLFNEHPQAIAAVIVEPVAGNMGCVPPKAGFMEGLHELCRHNGSVLIFDEVMTGFRLAPGGAQGKFVVRPDLTTLGKIIGGGLPVGAYGGKREIMELVAPSGPMYQAGTLSGNPLAMAAGLAQLNLLHRKRSIYRDIERNSLRLESGIREILRRTGRNLTLNRVGSMFTLFFTDRPVTDYASARRADTDAFGMFFRAMLSEGILLPPSQFEAAFLSAAHGDKEITRTLDAIEQALKTV